MMLVLTTFTIQTISSAETSSILSSSAETMTTTTITMTPIS